MFQVLWFTMVLDFEIHGRRLHPDVVQQEVLSDSYEYQYDVLCDTRYVSSTGQVLVRYGRTLVSEVLEWQWRWWRASERTAKCQVRWVTKQKRYNARQQTTTYNWNNTTLTVAVLAIEHQSFTYGERYATIPTWLSALTSDSFAGSQHILQPWRAIAFRPQAFKTMVVIAAILSFRTDTTDKCTSKKITSCVWSDY